MSTEQPNPVFVVNILLFARLLRQVGIPVALDQTMSFLQALALIDQSEPRQAAQAVVPFVKNGLRAPAEVAASVTSKSEHPDDSDLLAAEPALLAGMIANPAKASTADAAVGPDDGEVGSPRRRARSR